MHPAGSHQSTTGIYVSFTTKQKKMKQNKAFSDLELNIYYLY